MNISIGIAHCGICTFEMANTLAMIAYYQGQRGNGFNIIGSESCLPDANANHIMEQAKEYPCDWLFFLDTDIDIGAVDFIDKMVAHDKDAVAGVYYQGRFPFRPVLYHFTEDYHIKNFETVPDGLFRADAAGAGCLLLRKSIVDLFTPEYCDEHGKPFDPIIVDKKITLRADAAFFWRLKNLGVELWIDGDIPIQHVKKMPVAKGYFEKSKERYEKSASDNG